MDSQQQTDRLKPEEKLSHLAEKSKEHAHEGGFMEPGTTRKKRGRPAGSGKGQSQSGVHGFGGSQTGTGGDRPSPLGSNGPQRDPIAELMPLTTGLASFYSNMLVQIAEDERARPGKDKELAVAQLSACCLNQYFPNAFGLHAAAITLCIVVAETSFTAVRLRKENLEKYRAEARRRQAEGRTQPGSGQPNGAASQSQNIVNPFQQ